MDLPARGERTCGVSAWQLPPRPMPLCRRARLRKRWRYVGYYAADLMLCVGDARIGPIPQRWWAVATPGGELREATSIGPGGVDLEGLARAASPGTGVRVDRSS